MRMKRVALYASGVCAAVLGAMGVLVAVQGVPIAAALVLAGCADSSARDRTTCYENVVPTLYPEYPVRQVMSFIRALQAIDPALQDCHFIAHRLGETTAAEDPARWADAFVAAGDMDLLCSHGYTHGVAIRANKSGALTRHEADSIDTARTICGRVDADFALDPAAPSRCPHSLGHLFFFIAQGDMRRAFALCDEILPESGDGSSNRTRCHTGVAMQLIVPEDYLFDLAAPENDDEYLAESRVRTRIACESFDEPQHRGACMRGRWPLYARSILTGGGIDAFCADHPGPQRRVCIEKLAVTIGWFYVNDRAEAARQCSAFKTHDMQRVCFTMAAHEMSRQLGGTPRAIRHARRFCAYAPEPIAQSCDRSLQADS